GPPAPATPRRHGPGDRPRRYHPRTRGAAAPSIVSHRAENGPLSSARYRCRMALPNAQTYPVPQRRRHPRVAAGFLVTAHTGGQTMLRRAVDLSMTGVKLEGEAGTSDQLLLELPLPDQEVTVIVRSRVMRREAAATALCFQELDWG